MTLGNALQIGRSGLTASQTAIEIAGQNLANVGTKGYHRQVATLVPAGEQEIRRGVFIGRGVQLEAIARRVDEGLEGRIRGGIADESGAQVTRDMLGRIESLQNELSDADLSTQLGQFFNAWSELANTPNDTSIRTVVLQQGQAVGAFIRNLRSGLIDLRREVDTDLGTAAANVDDLLTRIEGVNAEVLRSDYGTGGAHSLRDQRDALLGELAQYMDISTVEQPSGAVDVYVGSMPIVLNGRSRGVKLETRTVDGRTQPVVALKADGTPLDIRAGKLGALLAARGGDVDGAIDTLDGFANELIHQVNLIHSQGQGAGAGFSSITGTSKVADPAAALNTAGAGLPYAVGHGSFQVVVTQKATGQRFTHTVAVDLDGINPAADTSLAGLAAALDALPQVAASVTPDGRLKIAAENRGDTLSFAEDTSGALAALGVNTFFAGRDARDIAVDPGVAGNPNRLAAGRGNIQGDNRNALALAGLRDQALPSMDGLSLGGSWDRHVADYAVRSGQAESRLQSDTVVRASLEAQQQSVSGVNTDEEAIDLLSYQRAYQGSARFLTVVDDMLQTLLQLV